MKIIKQSHQILYPVDYCHENGDWDWQWQKECKLIELAGRTAYKSEDKITEDSYKKFIEMIINRGLEAVLEFGNMVVKFVTDRGITHEIVRHRLCNFVQESTRYCNYSKDTFGREVAFIRPGDIPVDTAAPEHRMWLSSCVDAENKYLELLDKGCTPQTARSVLSNCTKTEIIVKANFREWRHIFRLRAINKAAHPDMRALMIPLYEQCRQECPVVFEMGNAE